MKKPNMEYRKTARTSPLFYILVVMGAIFVIGGFTLDPVKSCAVYDCPLWLRGLVVGFGFLFGLGGLSAIIRNFQYGSRLDMERHALLWWEGVPPITENIIPMDTVKTIVIEADSDNSKVYLLDVEENRIRLSGQCIPYPYKTWAEGVKQSFPHLTVREK